MNADEMWQPTHSSSGGRKRSSTSQFSLVTLLSPFSSEKQTSSSISFDTSKAVSMEPSHGSVSSSRFIPPPPSGGSIKQTSFLIPETSLLFHRLVTRRETDVRRSDDDGESQCEADDHHHRVAERTDEFERLAHESPAGIRYTRINSVPRDSLVGPPIGKSDHESRFQPSLPPQGTTHPTSNSQYLHTHTFHNTMSHPRPAKTRSPSSRRSPSMAIKIPSTSHPRSPFVDDIHEEITNEQFYNRITWCMYNRIVEHQQNRGLMIAEMPSIHDSSASTTASYIPSSSADIIGTTTNLHPTYGGELLDGEVFEMDI